MEPIAFVKPRNLGGLAFGMDTDEAVELATQLADAVTKIKREAQQWPESDTFPRECVEKLRTENGRYGQRAGEATPWRPPTTTC